MSEYQASQIVKKAALSNSFDNTKFRFMSRHSENMSEQYDEKTEIFITPQKNLEKKTARKLCENIRKQIHR